MVSYQLVGFCGNKFVCVNKTYLHLLKNYTSIVTVWFQNPSRQTILNK